MRTLARPRRCRTLLLALSVGARRARRPPTVTATARRAASPASRPPGAGHPAPQRQRRAPRAPTRHSRHLRLLPADRPVFVTSGLDSLRVYDVRDGAHPSWTGVLPSAVFENEAMNCGERRTTDGHAPLRPGRRRPRPGLARRHPTTSTSAAAELVRRRGHRPGRPARSVARTRPRPAPTRWPASTTTDCRFAYSAGDSDGRFSIFDLRNLAQAAGGRRRTRRKAGIQPFSSPTAGHKWNFDAAGYGTHTGYDGSSIWDVSSPRPPEAGHHDRRGRARATDPTYEGYNDFIHHNSFRPNAEAFKAGRASRRTPTATCCW